MKSTRLKSTRRRNSDSPPAGKRKWTPTRLRIVSGDLRGRKIAYNGDPATRPMKERTRESVFSLLGGKLPGYFVLDLFGGTGVLACETISRGASSGLILELSKTCVATIIATLRELGIDDRVHVSQVDTLRWLTKFDEHLPSAADNPWVVFCCPPYRMWVNESQKLCAGLERLYQAAPVGSLFVCETDNQFDVTQQLADWDWDVRKYAPAFIAVTEKTAADFDVDESEL